MNNLSNKAFQAIGGKARLSLNADVGHEDEQERTSEVVSGPDLLRGRGHTRIGIAARCIQSHHIMDRSRYWMAHGGRRGNPVV